MASSPIPPPPNAAPAAIRRATLARDPADTPADTVDTLPATATSLEPYISYLPGDGCRSIPR
ncbi:hypothetical protein GCM10010394_21100 [Streptomyces crystallinus]|uniref:Uncharacterized protein n=1 Tax=Streptomyces crystallinus TaxID=68191 RepID=A0ABN1FJ99_9ACTN